MNETQTANVVMLQPEGYVEVRLMGAQSYQTIESVGKACEPIINKLNFEKRPVLGLIDFTEDTSFDAGTNRAALEVLEGISYRRAALFGANAVMAGVIRALVAALGKAESTKVFETREEAVAWLVMKDAVTG